MHHYTYVRESRDAVERKLRQSALADGNNESVRPGWMETVYDRLPDGENLHAFTRWLTLWKSVEKIWFSDLPPAMQAATLLPLWFPKGEMIAGELNALHRLAKGRGQAVDLGTYTGLSAAVLALACHRCHTVDCYDDLPPDAFADTLDPKRYTGRRGHSLERTKALAARLGNLTCEAERTVEAAWHWGGGTVDVLFVDANHSEAAVLADVASWRPHLRSGARIIFHDDTDIHPGVQSAIRRLRTDLSLRFFDPGEFSGSLAVCDVL
jgi:hypothetical protein